MKLLCWCKRNAVSAITFNKNRNYFCTKKYIVFNSSYHEKDQTELSINLQKDVARSVGPGPVHTNSNKIRKKSCRSHLVKFSMFLPPSQLS